ncbi:MAG: hypothetical protein ABI693_09620, partial [Bryobacteraceae bacterium]
DDDASGPSSFVGTQGATGMSGGATGPAAITLYDKPGMPAQTLAMSGLFPGETVVFPFGGLPDEARRRLSLCFAEGGSER